MRRLAFLATLVFAAVSASACGSDSTGPAAVNVVGAYSLKSVNGTVLPWVFTQSSTQKVEVTADVISLNADGTFSDVTAVRITSGGAITTGNIAQTGVYSAANGAVQLTYLIGGTGTASGSVNGKTFTVLSDANSYVFQR